MAPNSAPNIEVSIVGWFFDNHWTNDFSCISKNRSYVSVSPCPMHDHYRHAYVGQLPSHEATFHPVIQPCLHCGKTLSNCIVRIYSCWYLDRMDPELTLYYASRIGRRRYAIPLQDDLLMADPSKKPTRRPQYWYPPDQARPSISISYLRLIIGIQWRIKHGGCIQLNGVSHCKRVRRLIW